MVKMAVASTDVMISLPVPHYISKRQSFKRLYKMDYLPHITLASGINTPSDKNLEEIKDFFTNIVSPPKITLRGLSALPVGNNNLLWANVEMDPIFEYQVGSFIPDWFQYLNEESDTPFPYTPYGFRPHVSLQYRRRPFRWLPKMADFTWTQRWAEIVEGDKVIARIVIGKRDTGPNE